MIKTHPAPLSPMKCTILKALTLSAESSLSVNMSSLFQSLGQCTISLSVDVRSVCITSLKSFEPFPHSGIHKEPGYSKMSVRKTYKNSRIGTVQPKKKIKWNMFPIFCLVLTLIAQWQMFFSSCLVFFNTLVTTTYRINLVTKLNVMNAVS